jgi:hypothetical protein
VGAALLVIGAGYSLQLVAHEDELTADDDSILYWPKADPLTGFVEITLIAPPPAYSANPTMTSASEITRAIRKPERPLESFVLVKYDEKDAGLRINTPKNRNRS